MYNLIVYSNNYSKTSGNLWQYYRDEPALGEDAILAICCIGLYTRQHTHHQFDVFCTHDLFMILISNTL